jgi:Uma2 family endonuclease
MGKRSHGRVVREFGVDERLVMPETRFEVIDGQVAYVSPADPPHASRHSKLSALLEAFVAEGFDAASDMLTRTSEKGDMAPDGSVYPSAVDPKTGKRQLEHLAFEVVSTESLGDAGKKASALAARGVRRVFAIDVERRRALEWSRRTGAWEILAKDAIIDDPAFALGLPVHDLVSAAKADDAVARALLAKGNPVLLEALEEARHEAKAEGKAEAIVAVLAARGLTIDGATAKRIRALRDPDELDRRLAIAVRCADVAELDAATKRPTERRRR